jgi:mannose-6-phosphate isomerase-like protein (cupin superfamily)
MEAKVLKHSRYCNDGVGYDNRRRPLSPGERMVNANHATYLVVGGAKLWIPNRDEFEALGYDWSEVESLSREALQQFDDVPIDGTLVKERSDSHTFVISGRHRWWVQDREQFDKNHFDWKDVHIVANGSLVSAPYAGPLP